MRILFVVPELDRPSTRSRILLYRPYLESRGAELQILPYPESIRKLKGVIDGAGSFDVVVLQKKLLFRAAFRRLRRRARKLIFDFDDAIFLSGPPQPGKHSLTRRWRFRRTVLGVDAVWCSNSYLAGLAASFGPRRVPICVVPTVIDIDQFEPKETSNPASHAPVALGWMGGPGNLVYLEDIREALAEVGRRRPGTALRILSQSSISVENLKVEFLPHSYESEARDLRSFDVGLSPLRDDPWCWGKMPGKTLHYYGAALPVVGSPVGSNPDIIRHGETGFTPRTPGEWVDALCYLIDNAEARQRMGHAGRKFVAERFSVQALAPVIWDHLERLIAQPPSGRRT